MGIVLAIALGCSRGPTEPADGRADATGTAAVRTGSSAKALEWSTPAGWATERVASQGRYRAKLAVPAVGSDREPAQVLISQLGRGNAASLDQQFGEWLASFEGESARSPERQALTAGGLEIRVLEVTGNYKQPLGPPVGPKGQHAAHVIKKRWRGLAAGVLTHDRTAWFFELVGADDTVSSARPAFLGMLQSLRER